MNQVLKFGKNAEIRVLRTEKISTVVDSDSELCNDIVLRTEKISTVVDYCNGIIQHSF